MSTKHVDERAPIIHVLKTLPEYFELSIQDKKPYEIRKNDRDFRCGDMVILAEYAPGYGGFTGRTSRMYTIEHIFDDDKYVVDNHVILTLKPINKPDVEDIDEENYYKCS